MSIILILWYEVEIAPITFGSFVVYINYTNTVLTVPPIALGAWSMALVLWQPPEYYYYYCGCFETGVNLYRRKANGLRRTLSWSQGLWKHVYM